MPGRDVLVRALVGSVEVGMYGFVWWFATSGSRVRVEGTLVGGMGRVLRRWLSRSLAAVVVRLDIVGVHV